MTSKKVGDFNGYDLHASDGAIGRITNVLFDDMLWCVRWLVADVGDTVRAKRILVAPLLVTNIDLERSILRLSLSKTEVALQPELHEHRPVSKAYEEAVLNNYQLPLYWETESLTPMLSHNVSSLRVLAQRHTPIRVPQASLRSVNEIRGYSVIESRSKNPIGTLTDCDVDAVDWDVLSLKCETSAQPMFSDEFLVIPSGNVRDINWAERKISIDLPNQVLDLKKPRTQLRRGMVHPGV